MESEEYIITVGEWCKVRKIMNKNSAERYYGRLDSSVSADH